MTQHRCRRCKRNRIVQRRKRTAAMSQHQFDDEEHTAKYRLHRPGYPQKLYEHIRDYYFNGQRTDEKIPLALDVGCGNGQATVDLSS